MFNINFNLRQPNSKKETPINAVVRFNKDRLVYPTGEKIHPKHWNSETQKVRKSKDGYSDYNNKLKDIAAVIHSSYSYLHVQNKEIPTIEELREEIKRRYNKTAPKEKTTDFIKYFEDHISNHSNILSKNTIRNRKQTLDLLKEYKNKILFDKIDMKLLNKFIDFLNDKGLAHNTIANHIKKTKTIMREAREDGYNFKIPKGFRFKEIETPQIYLNENELELLEKLDLTKNKRLANIRDLFLIGCWTALRISDLKKLHHEDIKEDVIICRTKKTDTLVTIPILPPLRRILDKYKDGGIQKLPRMISEDKFRKYAKEVGSMVKVLHVKPKEMGGEKEKYEFISTHTCRRSFSTNMYDKGIQVNDIMAITGHKSEKEFYKYIRRTPKEVIDNVKKAWSNNKTEPQSNLRIA